MGKFTQSTATVNRLPFRPRRAFGKSRDLPRAQCLTGVFHESPLPHVFASRWDLFRRDLLLGSDEHRLMPHPSSSGTTSVPRRDSGRHLAEGPTYQGRFSDRRDLLVRSDQHRSITRPIHRARQACPSDLYRRDLLVRSIV